MTMALWLLLWASALAADTDFKFLKRSGDCTYFFKQGVDSVPAMRAECEWSDVSLEQLDAMLGRYEDYDDYIFPITTSVIRSYKDDATLLFQRHKVFGFAPRESLVWIGRYPVVDGFEIRWSRATEHPLLVSPGAVETTVNEGFWRVVERVDGGVRIEHQVRVEAGAGLPKWLVSFFRTQGFIRIMGTVRAYGHSEVVVSKP